MPARTTGSGGASAQAILAPSAAAFFQQSQQTQHTGMILEKLLTNSSVLRGYSGVPLPQLKFLLEILIKHEGWSPPEKLYFKLKGYHLLLNVP